MCFLKPPCAALPTCIPTLRCVPLPCPGCHMQGLLGGMEGAVVRRVTSAAQDPGWRILYKTGNKFVQVGQTKQRPSRDDLVS